MKKIRTNATCLVCAAGINTLNGRYCTMRKRNVEYAEEPICVEREKSNIKQNYNGTKRRTD